MVRKVAGIRIANLHNAHLDNLSLCQSVQFLRGHWVVAL